MERKLVNCNVCGEETLHMIGKKQSTTKSSAYTRRSTSKCCKCGTKEIVNRKTGRRVIRGRNELPM